MGKGELDASGKDVQPQKLQKCYFQLQKDSSGSLLGNRGTRSRFEALRNAAVK